MKLFCACIENWIITEVSDTSYSVEWCNVTRQIRTNIAAHTACATYNYWYNADYENMMFDLREMNQ